MRTISLCVLTLLASCGGTPPSRRAPVVPIGPVDTSTQSPAALEGEKRVRTEADKTPPAPPQPEPAPADPRVSVSYRTVTQVIEKPVEVRVPEPAPRYEPYYGYAYGYHDPYAYPRDYGYRHCEQPWLPINTIAGAGIGALIGDANGHASDGAWIGAGVGLLFDLGRLCW